MGSVRRTFQRKKNRLELVNYRGPKAYFLTMRTFHDKPYFAAHEVVDEVRKKLFLCAQHCDFRVLAYCFMPDHLHLLAQGGDGSELITFVSRFKQSAAFQFSWRWKSRLWQRSFHDHILRRDEDLEKVAWYILNNSVRKGLVNDPSDYPFQGSNWWGKERMAP